MSIKLSVQQLQKSTQELFKQVRQLQETQNKVITSQNVITNAVKSSTDANGFNTNASNQESTLQVSQDYDYVPSVVGEFQFVTNGKTWKYDKTTGLIRLNTGDPITFGIFEDPSVFNSSIKRVGIVNKANKLFLRHFGVNKSLANSSYSPTWEYSWIIYKTESGEFELHNDFIKTIECYGVGYNASSDMFNLLDVRSVDRTRFSVTGTIDNKYLTPSLN